jgi:glycosyltransferase involved in cell wall biosynthesis
MVRVGWLFDPYPEGYVGGAELTQAEFRAAAPEGVEVVDCPPQNVWPRCDAYVIHNCMTYDLADLKALTGSKTVKYYHDVGPWLSCEVRDWLMHHAIPICCSPIQAKYMGLDNTKRGNAELIPPPVDLQPFMDAAASANGSRKGAVSVAAWRNHEKAPHRVAEWSVENNTPVDFYGGGELAPPGSQAVPYEAMPALLARYERFVFLPTVIEPFGRLVAEAWAAGCEVVTNRLVGARYWIEEKPEALQTAAEDFWRVVL